jgi:hypothetical protein
MIKEPNGFVMQLSSLYRSKESTKKVLIFTTISNLILVILLVSNYFSTNTVIRESDGVVQSYQGKKAEVSITQKEIKKLAENYIKRRYEWEKFDLNVMLLNLNSIVTENLKEKIRDDLKKDQESFKSISQYVGKLDLSVNQSGEVVGKFDKVLRLTARPKDMSDQVASLPEKIPLLSETQIQFTIVRGPRTDDNPLGLYINSVVEYGAR